MYEGGFDRTVHENDSKIGGLMTDHKVVKIWAIHIGVCLMDTSPPGFHIGFGHCCRTDLVRIDLAKIYQIQRDTIRFRTFHFTVSFNGYSNESSISYKLLRAIFVIL